MLLPLLILAGSGPVVMYAVSGMETPLYAFFLLLMLYLLELALSGGKAVHYALLAASGFLLSLCRPEGAAAFPVMALAALLLKHRGKQGAAAAARETEPAPLGRGLRRLVDRVPRLARRLFRGVVADSAPL